ncbi:hypothetical protein AAHC03_04910 [Spirometra sp. Aus1]
MSRPNDIDFSVSSQHFSPRASFAESTLLPDSPVSLDFLRNTIASTTATTNSGTNIGQSALVTASLLPPPTPADWLDWMKNFQAAGKLSFPFGASAAATLKPPEALISMVQQRTSPNQSPYFPPGLPLMPPTIATDMNSETNDEFPMNSLVKNSLLNMHLLAGQLPFWSLPPPSQMAAVSRTLRYGDSRSTASATADCIADSSPTHEEAGYLPKSLPTKCPVAVDEEKTARLTNPEETTFRSTMAGRGKTTGLPVRSTDPERSQLLSTLELSSTQLQAGVEECRRFKQSTISKNPDPSVLKLYQDLRFSVRSCQNVRRKNTTRETTGLLKAWLNDHRKNPYPNKSEKIILAVITKMTLTQVSTWFANARRRLKKENKALSSCLAPEEPDLEGSLPTDCSNFNHFPQLPADRRSFGPTGSASSPLALRVEDRPMSREEEVEETEQQGTPPAEGEEDLGSTTAENRQIWMPRQTNKIWSLVDLAVPQCESDESTRS